MSRIQALRSLFAAALVLTGAFAHAVSDLAITKTATSADTGLEGGDTVTYDIVITNNGDTPGFDVDVLDTPPAEFTACTLDNTIGGSGGGDLFGAGYIFTSFTGATANALDPGDSVTLQISCDLTNNVEDNSSYQNQAGVIWADSLGGPTFPEVTGADSVSTQALAAFAEIVATSEAHTSDATADTAGDPRPMVIGENVRVRVWFHVPAGHLFNTSLSEVLPVGVEYIPGSDVLIGLVTSSGTNMTATGLTCGSGTAPRAGNELTDLSTLGLDCVIAPSSGGSGSGDDPVFNLGTVTNIEHDPADEELIVLELNGRLSGLPLGNLPIQGRIVTDNSDVASTSVVALPVYPFVDISATVTPTDTGPSQSAEYVVTIQHNGGSTADGLDIELTDMLPAGLIYDAGSGITGPQIPAVPGTDTCSVSGLVIDDADPNGTGLSITFDGLALGDVCEVRYNVTTPGGATNGQQFISDVELSYSTLPDAGTDPNPTGSPPGAENTTLRSAQTTLTIDLPDLTKTIASTDLAATPDGTADTAIDPRTVAVGETVRMRLLTQLPEGTSTTVDVTDQLPTGLEYVAGSGRIALISDGLNISEAPAIVCGSGTLQLAGDNTNISFLAPTCAVEPTGGPFGSGTDPVWQLGALTNSDSDSDDEYVLIEFDAVVTNELANQNAVQLAGPYDFTANGSTQTSNEVVSEVREAQLAMTASAAPDPANNLVDTTPSIAWDLTVSNPGNIPGYQVGAPGGGGARFVLPNGLGTITNITLTPTGDVFLNGTSTPVGLGNVSLTTTNNTDDTLQFDQTLELDSGASLLIEFDAELLASVAPGSNLTRNTAVGYSSLPTGSSASGTRDNADIATGTGNTPIASTAALNDYRAQTALTLDVDAEAPAIDTVHTVSTGPTNNSDGTYTFTYTTTVTNTGNVGLDNVALTNDLEAVFGAGNFTVDAVRVASTGTTLTPDVSFDGTPGNDNILNPGTSTLPVGDIGTIEIDVTVTPGASLGPHTNTPVGSATSDRTAAPVNDNDSADVTFAEAPEIGVALDVVGDPTNNGDGTFTLTYRVTVENSGDVPLSGLQLTADLATTFTDAAGFTVDLVASADLTPAGGFDGDGNTNLLDGTDTLDPTSTATIDITVTVTPGADLGPYDATVVGSGTSPATAVTNDTSTTGTDPDANGNNDPTDDNTPTSITFGQNPEIGLALAITDGPNNNGDGTYTLTYQFRVENTGDTPLSSVQITDNLDTTFQGAPVTVDNITSPTLTVNTGFNGNGDQNLLTAADTLAIGEFGIVDVIVTVTPGATTGPFSNSANTAGTSPASTVVVDTSDAGTVVDGNGNGDPTDDSDPTITSTDEAPEIGLALQITDGPNNNGDGTYTLTYTFRVENTGDVTLDSLQVTDDLDATFQGAPVTIDSISSTDFSVDGTFNGTTNQNLLDGSDTLAAGGSGTIELIVTVTPGTNAGPFDNSADTSGRSPAGTVVTDRSDDAATVDENGNGDPTDDSDPTSTTIGEAPEIGLALQVAEGPINNGDGTHTITYRVTVENTGDVPLTDVQITNNLDTVFQGVPVTVVDVTSTTLTPNGAFNGSDQQNLLDGSDTLAVGAQAMLDIVVTVTPGANSGPFNNTATASGTSPASTVVTDVSDDAAVVDQNGNGDPTDDSDPTPVVLSTDAALGLAKAASASTANLDGTFTTTITLVVENTGTVDVTNIVLTDDIATSLAPATVTRIENLSLTGALTALNIGFNGVDVVTLTPGTETLPVGASATVTFDLVFAPNGNLGPFQNIATVSGESPSNPVSGTPDVSDTSTNGNNPDANGNGNPGDDSEPTPVTFTPGTDGTVTIEDDTTPGDPIRVTVNDPDVNADPDNPDTTNVVVTNDTSGESEEVELTETGPDTGDFVGEIPTDFDQDPGPDNDGELFVEQDDDVTVTYEDDNTSDGGTATVTDTTTIVGVAGISGNAWLDADIDNDFGAGEEPLEGWIIRLTRNGATVTEVPVQSDGTYFIPDLPPGTGYAVTLVHPESGAAYGVIDGLVLQSEVIVVEQNLPIDPSGIVYDSETRAPVPGAIVAFVRDDTGEPLPEVCLLDGQQNQTTGDDGFYRFDLVVDADPACASNATFLIVVTAPAGYNPGYSTAIPPIATPLDPTGLGDPVQVGATDAPPTGAQPTGYYVRFTLAAGDPNTVWNHIPLDPANAQNVAVRLTKQASKRTAEVGGMIAYTVTLENTTNISLPGVVVSDVIPAGFRYVEGSAAFDNNGPIVVTGARTVRFASVDLAPSERRTLRYLLRVGPSAVHGEHINTATPLLGPAPIGNTDTASVLVTSDPDFEQTTVIGKVFNDRDGDGWQDTARATDVRVTIVLQSPSNPIEAVVIPAGSEQSEPLAGRPGDSIRLGDMPGRYSINDKSGDNQAKIRLRYDAPVSVQNVRVTSDEGSQVLADASGTRKHHRGQANRGTTSQDLDVSFSVEPYHSGHDVIVTVTNNGLEEPGVPGVRLATVEGLLIETDAFGRYHIAGVDAGFQDRGRNFIVKLDPRTLPPGSEITTENPRVKRLSQGLMNQFDFGVQIPETELGETQVTVKIAEMFFREGSAEVLPAYIDGLRAVAEELRDGAIINLRLEAFTDEGGDRKLAEARAQALIEALCDLVGEDVSQQIKVSQAPAEQPERLDVGRVMDHLINFLVPSAYAEGSGCLADICRDRDGVPVMVIERTDPSVFDGAKELADQGRVDLIAERTMRLSDGGVIWLTEDPVNLTPRLAVLGPTHLPVANERVSSNATFAIHTNYAAFIDSLEVAVYDVRDADHRNPLALMRIDTAQEKRTLYKIDWQAVGLEGRDSDRLEYVVTARDADGRADRTHPHPISLVPEHLWAQQQLFAVAGRTPRLSVQSVGDDIYVFVPGQGGERVFEYTPRFEELGTGLSDTDRASLDDIVRALSNADQVALHVTGHTSSKRIAPRSRKHFEDNYRLATARAQTVADFFSAALGDKLIHVTQEQYGPDRPVADNATSAGLAANRRAEARLTARDGSGRDQVHQVPRQDLPTHIRDDEDIATPDTQSRVSAGNDLVLNTIPVYGSRVRVHGYDVGPDHLVRIQGERIPLDRNRRFAVEYLLPVGEHELHIDVIEPRGERLVQRMPFTVDGSYRFLVALADFTVSDSTVSGAIEPLAASDHYDDDMLVEGRLAFYLKGKVQGKYLITAQLDTREDEIEHLFDDIHRKDPQSLFRRLDPDRYYPVYGDDSTTIADVNTHGRMYARVDWDKSSVLWGNFNTGLTGNELIQYNRGLYGLQGSYRSVATTKYDDAKTTATVFGSENQTALGHSEFLGTGGSLYYLRHTDILPGSEKVNIEVRDPSTNRVIANQALARTVDYEVDELQGRIILNRPLMQIAQQSAPSLITDGALDGNIAVMLVDYEYVPSGFDANHVTYGARAKHWVGDHVGIGLTYVEEGRAAEDYTLAGADVTLKAGKDSWVKVEYGTSEASQSERFFSADGGLSFANLSNAGLNREGDAYSVDLHVNAADFGGITNWVTNAWYKDVDDQFSIARRDDGFNVIEYGIETQLPIGEHWQVGARASVVEATGQFERTEAAVQVERSIGANGTATGEVKYIEEERPGVATTDAVMAAAQYEHEVTDKITVYGGGQMTVEQDAGYDNNDQAHLGVQVDLTANTSAQVEGREGHRGSSILASIEHDLNERHTIYGTVTHSTDRTDDGYAHRGGYTSMLDNVGTNIAAGHRWVMNDRVNLFTEGQHTRGEVGSGVGHVFGLDYADQNGLHAGLTVQRSDVPGGAGVVDRTAYSASLGYRISALRYASKLEYREDRGANTTVQWLSTNRLDYKINDTYRVAAKFNYGLSENDQTGLDVGKLMEGSLGIARRPVDDNRFNWLAKYTYLYDLQSAGQEDPEFDRRLQVLSWEGVYKLTQHFDLGAKVARRQGEVRLARDFGPWFDSTANFAAARVRWHVHHKWDALLEGRWLELEESDEIKVGALIAIERHFADHFKLGVGYNFTDFSDDLTNLDFDHKGWFINAIGKY